MFTVVDVVSLSFGWGDAPSTAGSEGSLDMVYKSQKSQQ